MIAPSEQSIAEQISAALDWWREAGVDCDFADEPRGWLAEVSPEAAPATKPPLPAEPPRARLPAAPALAAIGGDAALWPKELADFAPWWLAEPSLDNGMVMDRVAPRGVHGAEVMVLVAEPELQDTAQLLSGPQGKLLDAMLAAMGIAPSNAYIASALPRRTPAADWQGLAAAGLGDVLRHHVALVAPQRLIAFGGNILPLLGNDLPISPDSSRRFNHEGRSIPLMAAMDLAALLARPRAKAGFWRNWLEWTGQDA